MRAYLPLFGRAFTRFGQDKCTSFAAAISYYALFSIFPLLLFVVSCSGVLRPFRVPAGRHGQRIRGARGSRCRALHHRDTG